MNILARIKSAAPYVKFLKVRTMSSASNLDISGIYPPIATPFDADENISWEKLHSNMDKWNKMDFKGKQYRELLGMYGQFYSTPI